VDHAKGVDNFEYFKYFSTAVIQLLMMQESAQIVHKLHMGRVSFFATRQEAGNRIDS
jgi:hypothetical protein